MTREDLEVLAGDAALFVLTALVVVALLALFEAAIHRRAMRRDEDTEAPSDPFTPFR